MIKYSVLLLRPEYLADPFGQDTYLAFVEAPNPQRAVQYAQWEAGKADHCDETEDYYPLLVIGETNDTNV